MIKFFFNRFGRMVAIMEVLGILLLCLAVFRSKNSGGPAYAVLFTAVVLEYAFIRCCASRRWYAGAPRYSGIELQFKKALVPTSYILAILGAALFFFPGLLPLIAAAFLLAVIGHVNIILLYFHRRDKDRTPPNRFSGIARHDDAIEDAA